MLETGDQLVIELFVKVALPLLRLSLFIALGLFIAGLIENLNWTHHLALLARPLIRIGRLSAITGASFSTAFFSGVSANTMLAEAYDKGQISKKELLLANLFNSLPRFFLHLPTVFFLTAPLIKLAAVIYVTLTFSAALLQTVLVVIAGRILLSKKPRYETAFLHEKKKNTLAVAVRKSLARLRKRIGKILSYLVPVYLIIFIVNRLGLFSWLDNLATHLFFLNWLDPKALGIVLLHVTAEFSAGLAAASALLADNSLSYNEVVLALIIGNILATPIRALRHQLPYYTAIYPPALALYLVALSQFFRAFCVVFVTVVYFLFF